MNVGELNAIGVQVSADADGNLRIKADASVLTPHFLGTIANAKPALLIELRGQCVNFVNFNSRVLDPAKIQETPESEVHHVWILHFIDDEPREVHCTPALSRAEVLTCYPLAVGSHPFEATREHEKPMTFGQGVA